MELIDKKINDALEEELAADESKRFIKSQRALFGDPSGKIRTFAILSPENPLGLEGADDAEAAKKWLEYCKDPVKYNADKLKEIKLRLYSGKKEERVAQKKELEERIKKTGDTTLSTGGFDYVGITGHYQGKEHSIMVLNCTAEDAVALARAYGQESFFFGIVSKNPSTNPSQIAYYKTTNYCRTYKLVEISNTVTDETEATDFFSKFGAKFKINMQEFGNNVTPVINDGRFKQSFESTTFMGRASARRDSRRS